MYADRNIFMNSKHFYVLGYILQESVNTFQLRTF